MRDGLHVVQRKLANFVFWSSVLLTLAVRGAEPVRYNRDIRPILSDKCFFCHGFDEKKREAGLRLDVREGALKKNAIVPGKPEKSELLKRVTTKDAGDHMPPAKSKLASLTTAEVELLRRWIAEGANYEAHWAFIPLAPGSVPEPKAEKSLVISDKLKASAPSRPSPLITNHYSLPSMIDRLVSAGLAARKLTLQPAADPATLLRRVSFDLTGLPPTPAEVEAFLQDKLPDAYERAVDRLLASPHFGERMAVDWLDIARYADSYGFQVDREREMWP